MNNSGSTQCGGVDSSIPRDWETDSTIHMRLHTNALRTLQYLTYLIAYRYDALIVRRNDVLVYDTVTVCVGPSLAQNEKVRQLRVKEEWKNR
jgi:hypothetical protein